MIHLRQGIFAGLAALAFAMAPTAPVGAQSAPPLFDLTEVLRFAPKGSEAVVTLTRGVRSHRDLRTAHLRDIRRRMVDGQKVSQADLTDLADAGDGLAALRLARALGAPRSDADRATIAQYYGFAAATGRAAGLRGLVGALQDLELGALTSERATELETILMAYVEAGNVDAIAAVLDFHDTGKPFGPMPKAIARIEAQNTPVLALHRAGALIQTGWENPQDLQQAKVYLESATGSAALALQAFARTMVGVLEGRLGELTGAPAKSGGRP